MHQVKVHKIGLVTGGLMAIFHAIWALLVLFGWAKPLMDWILGLHFLSFEYSVDPFTIGNALLLVIVTGIIGYIGGVILGWLWNVIHGAVHNQ